MGPAAPPPPCLFFYYLLETSRRLDLDVCHALIQEYAGFRLPVFFFFFWGGVLTYVANNDAAVLDGIRHGQDARAYVALQHVDNCITVP